MSDQWTKKLPSLMEGYEEAAPEGLWDAVQAGLTPEKRRPLAGWWYAAAGLAAAAAIVLAVFLWKPAAPVSLVPEDRIAQGNNLQESTQAPVTEVVEAEEPASPEEAPVYIPAEPREPETLEPETPVSVAPESAVTQPEETVTEEVPIEETLPETWPESFPEAPVKRPPSRTGFSCRSLPALTWPRRPARFPTDSACRRPRAWPAPNRKKDTRSPCGC